MIRQYLKKVRIVALSTTLVVAAVWPAAAQVDTTPPTANYSPQPGSTLLGVSLINVVFSEGVQGVIASDLLINGAGATSVTTNNLNDYTFFFPLQPAGTVQVAWAGNQAITDLASPANPFAGGSWTYTVDPNAASASFTISEFLADNGTGLRDDDGSHSDWIELQNVGNVQGVLDGWYLTDTPTNLTKWQFPAGTPPLQANNFLVVFASSKNRTNPLAPLHTNFKLGKDAGGYLALVDPQGNVVSAFPNYPAQQTDISYGRDAVDPNIVGYFSTPTPGKINSTTGSGIEPAPIFSIESGVYTNDSMTLTITLPTNAPAGSTIRYILNPTTATNLPGASSTLYSGPITLTNNALVKARVFPPAGTNLFPSTVVARNYVFLDSTDRDFNSNLPLIVISTQGQAIPQDVVSGGNRAEGTVAFIETFQGRSSIRNAPQFIGPAGFEIFGQTSAGFPKRPIRIEIHDGLGNDQGVPVFGLPSDSDWRLRNPYDDKTYLNDFLGYELFEKMGHYSCRRRLVEVFVDTGGGRLTYPGDYYGIMVLFETIKVNKDRVDVPSLTPYDNTLPNISGGYIFAKDKDSGGDVNFATAGGNGFPGEALKIHAPKPIDIRTSPLQATQYQFPGSGGYTTSGSNQLYYLRTFLNTMESKLYAPNWLTATGTNHYSYYMDVDRFVDFHWTVEFTKQIDGIRLSSYFTKERGTTNASGQFIEGKVGPGPVWDWNLSFGNANYLRGGTTNGWYYAEQDQGITANEDIWLRRLRNGDVAMGVLADDQSMNVPGSGGDPDFNQKVADRWAVLRTDILNGTNVVKEIDQLSTLLSEAANRDAWGPSGKYRSSLVGVYQWPNPSGANDVNNRDVDYFHPTNYLGDVTNSIIGQMKKWVMGRYLWIDRQFTAQPNFSATDGLVTNGFPVTVTPPAGSVLYYTLDGTDPRASGGGAAAGVLSNSGPLSLMITSNVRIVARAREPNATPAIKPWYNTWSAPRAVSLFTVTPPLRITEIMYHPFPPPPGSPFEVKDFEYIEVKNIAGTPLNVNRFSIGGGVQFQFPNTVLAGGQSAVIVANIDAFQSRYGTNNPNILILGAYTGHLNNDGDHLVLFGSILEPILDFSFDDHWYPATDGFGFSLVTVDENAPLSAWNLASNWRPSSASPPAFGSPGQNDPAPPPRPAVVVNEVLTHETLGTAEDDAIELRNTTGSPADISGWFLTDDFGLPQKYVIPPTTVIPANGFIVFYASNSFGNNGLNSFRLGAEGDQVYLFSGDGTKLTGYAQGFDFGAAPAGVTFGRYIISTGADHFVAQKSNTLGNTNSGPLVGPIVVSEINYHPPDVASSGLAFNNLQDEFIELQNISSNPVTLYDSAYPSNTWHLRDAVDYDFPTGVTLPAGGFLLVVSFDPAADAATTAAFRARNFVPDALPLYGPWQHALDNNSANVELRRPDVPTTNGVPYILVERVKYSDDAPWPTAADGFGLTLQRLVPSSYGNDPTNWIAVAPSPGSNYVSGGTAPVITSQPGDRLIPAGNGTDVLLTASATGTAPLRYQWRFNGLNLAGANSSTLLLTNFQFSQAGVYNIFVYNNGGSTLGTDFTLSARPGLRFTAQPVNRIATLGNTTNFTLAAVGTGTLRYQWQFKPEASLSFTNIPSATNSVLTLTNVSLVNQGSYRSLLADDFDSTTSQEVTLTIVFKPTFTSQPLSQSGVVGGTVTFTVSATGTTPMSFRWRRPATLTNGSFSGYIVSTPTYSFLTVTNLQPSDAATYTVVVTNIAGTAIGGPTPGLSSNAVLTVLADTDHDGLADSWQTNSALHPCFPGDLTANPPDGARDDDGDGVSNADEYRAGTDPCDPTSKLKAVFGGDSRTIQFNAVSNRTYSVQYNDRLIPGQWQKLTDIMARGDNRLETVVDSGPRTNRFYRVVTPIQP